MRRKKSNVGRLGKTYEKYTFHQVSVAHASKNTSRKNKRRSLKLQKVMVFLAGIILGLGIIFAFFLLTPVVVKVLFDGKETNELITPNQKLTDMQDLQSILSNQNIQSDSIQKATESSALVFHLVTGGYVYFDSTKDLFSQASVLSQLLQRISIEDKNKKIQYIDMRFEKAIVKFE